MCEKFEGCSMEAARLGVGGLELFYYLGVGVRHILSSSRVVIC